MPPPKSKPRKSLTAANLEALGAARLAQVLMDIAEEQPAAKVRLRLELAGQSGSQELADELHRRLDVLAGARGRVPWRKLKALRQDLGLLTATITGALATADPLAALRLLLRFAGLERAVMARLKDPKGEVAQLFTDARQSLAQIAPAAAPAPPDVVEAIVHALNSAPLGAMGEIATAVVPALDALGLVGLRARIETVMAPGRRVNAGWRAALHAVLDAQGDADAYADTWSASEAVLPPVGARIARRFLAAGKLDAAAIALARSDPYAGGGQPASEPGLIAWEAARIDLLEAKGEGEAAQAARWDAFERDLSPGPLRAYLQRLEGFDDVVATDRALDYAQAARPLAAALRFLIAWPALGEAAATVLARTSEIDGLAVGVLEPAVRALEDRYPLAATLILRAMVWDVARFRQADLYHRARAWLAEAESLAGQVSDLQGHDTHAEFEQSLPISAFG